MRDLLFDKIEDDSDYQAAITALKNDTELPRQWRRHKRYLKVHGELLRYKHRIVIPDGLRKRAIKYAHSFSHLSAEGTLQLLMKHYWWPRMPTDVREQVPMCRDCLAAKSGHTTQTYLTNWPAWKFNDTVHIDIVGPFKACVVTGATYILTMADRFTRYLRTVPLTETTAVSVTRAFRDGWLHLFGPPNRVVTDRGDQFVGKLFRTMESVYGFKHVPVSAYHPQGNGIVERTHRFLKDRLSIAVAETGGDADDFWDRAPWTDVISDAMLAWNGSISRTHKLSPHELVFGDSINVPTVLNADDPTTELPPTTAPVTKRYVRKLKKNLMMMRSDALNAQILYLRQRSGETERSTSKMRPGCVVWRKLKKQYSKDVGIKWTGPWVIESRPSSQLANIRRADVDEKEATVEVVNIKFLKMAPPMAQKRGQTEEYKLLAKEIEARLEFCKPAPPLRCD